MVGLMSQIVYSKPLHDFYGKVSDSYYVITGSFLQGWLAAYRKRSECNGTWRRQHNEGRRCADVISANLIIFLLIWGHKMAQMSCFIWPTNQNLFSLLSYISKRQHKQIKTEIFTLRGCNESLCGISAWNMTEMIDW